MHHKRKRPKNRRAGCLLCKPWKANGAKRLKTNRPRALRRADEAGCWGVAALVAMFALAACSQNKSSETSQSDTSSVSDTTHILAGIDLRQPLRALGTEPFWGVDITPAALVYTTIDSLVQRAPNPTLVIRDSIATFHGITPEGMPMIVTLTTATCSDGMSDRTYPFSARVQLGTVVLRGCAASQEFLDTTPAP